MFGTRTPEADDLGSREESCTIDYLQFTMSGEVSGFSVLCRPSLTMCKMTLNQEKGVLAKGVSVESSVTPKETKNTRGHWAQQFIWHSERHSQERRIFWQKPPSKNPLFWAGSSDIFYFSPFSKGGG